MFCAFKILIIAVFINTSIFVTSASINVLCKCSLAIIKFKEDPSLDNLDDTIEAKKKLYGIIMYYQTTQWQISTQFPNQSIIIEQKYNND